MRMWLVLPKFLCRKHLLGEHVEMHMIYGALKKNFDKSLKGLSDKKFINASLTKSRHDELAKELVARGYKHNSHMNDLPNNHANFKSNINYVESVYELVRRCPECKKRIFQNIFG